MVTIPVTNSTRSDQNNNRHHKVRITAAYMQSRQHLVNMILGILLAK